MHRYKEICSVGRTLFEMRVCNHQSGTCTGTDAPNSLTGMIVSFLFLADDHVTVCVLQFVCSAHPYHLHILCFAPWVMQSNCHTGDEANWKYFIPPYGDHRVCVLLRRRLDWMIL